MAFRDKADDADRIVTWGERILLWSGIASANGAVILGVWAVVVKFLDGLPIWAAIFIGLLLATSTMRFLYWWKKKKLIRGQRSIDIEEIGRDCVTLFREYGDVVTAQPQQAPYPSGSNAMQQWQMDVAHSTRIENLITQRFAARTFATVRLVESLGIRAPDMHTFHGYQVGSMMAFLGAVGELLLKGQLEEAKKLDPRKAFFLGMRA